MAMQADVRFGLVMAAGVALACGSKRLSFITPEASTKHAVAETASAEPATDAPTAPNTNSALVDLFPSDLRDQVNVDDSAKNTEIRRQELATSRPSKKSAVKNSTESTLKSAGQKSEEIVLPGMDWLDASLKEEKPSEADKPKALPEQSPEPQHKRPAHPYFQRYIDEGAYFVREGDTLADIAHNLYQDPGMIQAILDANADLLKSSDDLRAGMRLKLPK